jgi:hypothetical protein
MQEVKNTMEKITRKNVLQVWANQYPEVVRWLTKLQKKESSALFFYKFCHWAHKTPTELLTLKEKDSTISPPPNEVEKLLDNFCGEAGGDKNSEKYNIAIQVKSFFKWSYRDLAKASGIVSLEKVKPYNALSKEGLRKLYDRALNPRERALIPFVTCTGIAKEALTNLTWGHLEENWETKDLPCINIGSELLKGHGKGKYKGVRQITFLTPEAKRELINYKGWIEQKLGRKVTPQDHIWLETYEPYKPLGYDSFGQRILALSKNAGVSFSWHDGRRWVNNALEQISISTNWARKIRGRKVKGEEAPYSQPQIDQLREKFREAVHLLEFTSGESKILEDRVKELEKFKAGLTPEQIEVGRHLGIIKRKEASKPEPEELENCEDGKHCGGENFKQVTEAELLEHLRAGWAIAHKLSSGEVIVKRA